MNLQHFLLPIVNIDCMYRLCICTWIHVMEVSTDFVFSCLTKVYASIVMSDTVSDVLHHQQGKGGRHNNRLVVACS